VISDYLLHISIFGRNYLVFCIEEVKRPKNSSSQLQSDTVKAGKMMKMYLDNTFLSQGVETPLSVGVVVDGIIIQQNSPFSNIFIIGHERKTYKVVLMGNGIYTKVYLQTFYLMRDEYDIGVTPSALCALMELKVNSTLAGIDSPFVRST
jgi:hypothetical protein